MDNSQAQQNIFNLKLHDVFIFPVSWSLFIIIGRAFFESGLGHYHSTHSKKWASLCKSLFLLTFVNCCTLLELVTFEILDLLHPALRLFIWTTSLAILAVLLNVLIPAVLAISLGFHANFSVKVSVLMGSISVGLFQLLMWTTGVILHHCHHTYYLGNGLESSKTDLYGNSLNAISSPSILKAIFMFDPENANGLHSNDLFTPFLRILDLIVRFDVQRSIANIAVLGTICAAVISGFATVFFPLEQLLIFRGVDAEQLRRRERSLSQLLREIATRKKEFLIISKTPSPPYTPKLIAKTAGTESLGDIDDSIESENMKHKFSAAFDTMDRELDEHPTNKINKNLPGIPLEIKQNVVHCCAVSNSDFTLITLKKNVLLLEELSAILFTEIIALKEQQHMAEMARTKWGRVMRFLGQILT